jgi:hypothetical protein
MTILRSSFRHAVKRSMLLCGLSIAAVACGSDTSNDDIVDLDRDGLLANDAAKLVQVTANGTGCPAGSWNATLDASKKSFIVSFSSYIAQLKPESSLTVKDCQLAVKLDGRFSYAVEALGYDASAALGDGVQATASAEAYLQGDPSKSVSFSKKQVGPFKGTITVGESIPAAKQVWSTCGVDRDVNIKTLVRVQKGSASSSGMIRLPILEGGLPGATGAIRFAVRSCGNSSSGSASSSGTSVTRVDSSTNGTSSAAAKLTITNVSANGTGCPTGTWSAVPTAANTIDVRLNGVTTAVTPSKSIDVKDCQLALTVGNTAGLSYAVKSVTYSGRASLRDQAQAQLTANYYFQGEPSMSGRGVRSFSAPLSGDYTFQHDVADADAVWSPCGLERELNVATRARLLNGPSTTSSSFDLTRVSGLTLSVRACSAGSTSSSGTSSAGTTPSTDGPSIISVTRH